MVAAMSGPSGAPGDTPETLPAGDTEARDARKAMMSGMSGTSALATLAEAGFDIAHTFDAAAAAREPGLAVLSGGRRLGILIGSTRALWPPFCAALGAELAGEPDPLERYTERAIDGAFAGARIHYGHRRHDGAFLPLQRLAVVTGLGALAPSQLVIHPVYGPWFALRAVVLLDERSESGGRGPDGSAGGENGVSIDGAPPERAPIAPPCRCTAACADRLLRAQRSGDWRDWLAVRDACSLQQWRYPDDQIRFHYSRMRRSP
jgi:methylmalonic aciduria homocystinuria type C protein